MLSKEAVYVAAQIGGWVLGKEAVYVAAQIGGRKKTR